MKLLLAKIKEAAVCLFAIGFVASPMVIFLLVVKHQTEFWYAHEWTTMFLSFMAIGACIGNGAVFKLIVNAIETFYIKNDKEMYETIMNTNENSVFIKEDELKW